MKWHSYFDGIFVTSAFDSERRPRLIEDFKRYGISFKWNYAVLCEDGKEGIYKSLTTLFKMSKHWNMSRILHFEDDCSFKCDPATFNSTMNSIVSQAMELDWLQIKLGSVLLRPPDGGLERPNLFKISGSYGLHACAYTREFMELALSLPMELPVDVSWQKSIESLGRSYHTYPLLCSQYPGFSSIQNENKNWDWHISGSFQKHTQKIKEQHEGVVGNNHL